MFLFRPLRNSVSLFNKESLFGVAGFRGFCQVGEEEEDRKTVDPKDRSKIISVETSIRYLKSKAYKEAYGNEPVWKYYRRNFKGPLPPETRLSCIWSNRITTGNPCPICRDEYLIIDYRNVDLLEQFISDVGGDILKSKKTGVCQRQHKKLQAEINKARNYGKLEFSVPHRTYDYSLYYTSNIEDSNTEA